MIRLYIPAAALIASLAFGGGWWGAVRFEAKPARAERDEARGERDAANRSLLVLTEAGTQAQDRAAKALKDAQAGNAGAGKLIARLRADLAAGPVLSCTDAATRVRAELAP